MCINNPKVYSGVILLCPALRVLPKLDNFMIKWAARVFGSIMPRTRLFSYPQNSATKYNLVEKFKGDKLIYNGGIVPKTIKSIFGAIL